MSISVRKLLSNNPLEASAPCRVDAGGTWDIKAMALPFEKIHPVTVNIALNLRTRVILSAFEDDKIKISSQGFSEGEVYSGDHLPFDSPFGLYCAAVTHFGFNGLEIRIKSESPVKSALGGSSTALVALVKALDKINTRLGEKARRPRDILHMAYHLEDAVAGGNCGIQDQGAATYGGVNLWTWNFSNSIHPFARTSLLGEEHLEILSRHLLVAHSGESHVAATSNRKWIEEFFSGKTRKEWLRVNEIVHNFANKLRELKWSEAAYCLREEMSLRREITPGALIPITQNLIQEAEETGCGARFAGAGAGGAVWAIGELEHITKLRKSWKKTLDSVEGAEVLICAVDKTGVT